MRETELRNVLLDQLYSGNGRSGQWRRRSITPCDRIWLANRVGSYQFRFDRQHVYAAELGEQQFNGMMIYQRRQDRRPVVLIQENLLGPGTIGGTVSAKWEHVILAGIGTYDARIVAGTMRLIVV